MNKGDKVYRLGKKSIRTSDRKYWLYQFMFHPNNHDKKVWMKTPFDTIMCSKRYIAHLMAIKEFMDNGHTLIDSGAITIDKFDDQLRMVWYPLVLSFIDNYEKDMVPFDIRVAINDVETRAFGAETSNWQPKILEYIHDGRALPIDMLTIDRL